MTDPLRILSLGAGVQSTTVLLMSLAGELPRLDAAVFADTGWERAATYTHLDRLEVAAREAGVPVYRVGKGDLRADALDPAHGFVSIPAFTPPTPASPRGGMGRRQCTREYKLAPIRSLVWRLHREAGRRPVEQWIAFSFDERIRVKDSGVRYITNRHPLIERRITRWACERWLAARGWQVPRSACIGCPLHSKADWRALTPEEFADAAEFEAALPGEQYLHADLVPLPLVDLSTEEDRGQLNLFVNECEGMCGV